MHPLSFCRALSAPAVGASAADARGRVRECVLRFGVLRERLGIVGARLREVLLRLNDLEHAVDSELAAVHAELEALRGEIDRTAGKSDLVETGACGRIGLDDRLCNVIVEPLAG